MKRNGFTLIELLAVIVILAIIALIATPIILGIINDAREESEKRSVELYASAVKNGVIAYELRTGKIVSENSYNNQTLPFEVEYDGNIVCKTVDIYKDGGVYIANCTVNGAKVNYTYGTKKIIKRKLNSVCTPSETQYFTDNPLEAGYKYNCKVDPDKDEYTFYVLTTPKEGEDSISLIMNTNIRKDGTPTQKLYADKGEVSWMTKSDYISEEIGGTESEWGTILSSSGNWNKGPITAMNHLATATVGWTNVNTHTISKFTSCDSNGMCLDNVMAKTYTVNARLPYYSEVSGYKASANNAYLYDNLQTECIIIDDEDEWQHVSCDEDDVDIKDGVFVEGLEHIPNVNGYWTLSAASAYYNQAFRVFYSGKLSSTQVGAISYTGVRPVISLDI